MNLLSELQEVKIFVALSLRKFPYSKHLRASSSSKDQSDQLVSKNLDLNQLLCIKSIEDSESQ